MTGAASAQNLLAEILQPATAGEEQIAYRQGQRYVARLSPAQPAVINHAALIRPDASYLITGGLGSLGLQTAQWLVAAGAQQLILTGRRGVQSPIQQAILDELRAQGATVQIAQVDVADKGALTQLFAELATLTPPLRGIIHAAGTAGNKPISALEWADFVPLLQPKVVGGWLLHRLSAGFDLDFFLAYSSGAGIWGGKQQGHYGAANHFLDGLMAYRRSQGLPGLSIAWGPWAGPSGLPSMAGPEGQAALLALGVRTLPAPQGLAIQAHLLRTAAVQVTAADIDWTRLKALYELTKPRRFLAQLGDVDPLAGEGTGAAPVAENAVLQEVRALPASQRLERLRRYVQQTLGQVLGMAELPARTVGFAELGMDSLMALELRRQLARDLACALPTTIAFEYPTVEQLAGYLLELVQPQTIAPVVPLVEQGNKAAVTEPIAIISMACRFPGADTPEAFWELLAAGVDLVQEIPLTRWNVDDFYAPQRPTPGKMYTRAAALIEGVDQFDPLFFGIAPREAQGIDPLHRLLLEVSWEVLERAGLAQQALIDSPTGVFVGIGEGEYGALSSMGALTELDTHVATSGGHSAAAGRLAYTLGLQGPTLAVDTACSSSLVALHLACQSLRLGECDLALAGGMNLTLSPVAYIALSQMNALAVDGRCKTFDAAADGYGRGEGGGMVLLKRLSDAQRDGDKVWAVIQGSAVNHDGPSSGLTVPNKRTLTLSWAISVIPRRWDAIILAIGWRLWRQRRLSYSTNWRQPSQRRASPTAPRSPSSLPGKAHNMSIWGERFTQANQLSAPPSTGVMSCCGNILVHHCSRCFIRRYQTRDRRQETGDTNHESR